jgi:hypothetical protein
MSTCQKVPRLAALCISQVKNQKHSEIVKKALKDDCFVVPLDIPPDKWAKGPHLFELQDTPFRYFQARVTMIDSDSIYLRTKMHVRGKPPQVGTLRMLKIDFYLQYKHDDLIILGMFLEGIQKSPQESWEIKSYPTKGRP